MFLSAEHTSYSVNKIASALRCVRSADQNMAAYNRPLLNNRSKISILINTKNQKGTMSTLLSLHHFIIL